MASLRSSNNLMQNKCNIINMVGATEWSASTISMEVIHKSEFGVSEQTPLPLAELELL